MSLREKLQPASFRNISFLVEAEREAAGKKVVVHEYPNSDKRFVEELGRIPSTFTLDAILHGDTAIQQRNALKNALERDGLGELVHPVYGTLQVQATTYSVSSNQRNIGEFRFSIIFERSEPVISASPQSSSKQTVSNKSGTARNALSAALEAAYNNPSRAFSLESAVTKIRDVVDNIEEQVTSVTDPVTAKVAEFNREINDVRNRVYRIAQRGSEVKDSLDNLYGTGLAVTNDPAVLYEQWNNFVDFNLDEGEVISTAEKTNTVSRERRATNNNILDEHTRLTALVNAYEAAVYKTFTTQTQLNEVQKRLDSKFDDFMKASLSQVIVSSLLSDATVRQTLSDLRNAARQSFDDKEQRLWRVVDIAPGNSSMILMAYRYYGNIDQLDLLTGLNPLINYANFKEYNVQAVTR